MSFCPVCGTNHDSNYLCIERGREALHKAGIETDSPSSKEDFKKLEKKADRYMFKLLLQVIVVLFIVFLISYIINLTT